METRDYCERLQAKMEVELETMEAMSEAEVCEAYNAESKAGAIQAAMDHWMSLMPEDRYLEYLISQKIRRMRG